MTEPTLVLDVAYQLALLVSSIILYWILCDVHFCNLTREMMIIIIIIFGPSAQNMYILGTIGVVIFIIIIIIIIMVV